MLAGGAAPRAADVGLAGGHRRGGGHDLPWTLVLLAYLLLIALFYRGVLPAAMQP